MNPDWKNFLVDNGAEYGADDSVTVESFGNPPREQRAALNGNVMCDLSHHALIEVFGEDARTFLQNQTSNNMSEVTSERSRLGSYCTPKGRAITTFRALQKADSDSLYLSLSRDLQNTVLNRLRMFVLMSKVTLENANEALVRFGISGPSADAEVKIHLGTFPENIDDCLQSDGLTVIRVPGEMPRFEVYGYLEPAKKFWEQLNVNCAPVGADAWALLDIQAAVPHIVKETSEMFVPQMLNLQLIDAVSFSKGCYPGQEVVARMHYLGKLKRRMYIVHIEAKAAPEAGTPLIAMNNEEESSAGNIVNAVSHPTRGVVALAVIISRFLDEGASLLVDSEQRSSITEVAPPPYGFEDEAPEQATH